MLNNYLYDFLSHVYHKDNNYPEKKDKKNIILV